MNFTTYLIEGIRKLRDAGVTDSVPSDLVCSALLRAHKYVLPPPRSIRTRIDNNSLPFIRMPFPEMVFEYEVPDAKTGSPMIDQGTTKSSRRVALMIDLRTSNTILAQIAKVASANRGERVDLILLSGFWSDADNVWAVSMGYAGWSAANEIPGFSIDGDNMALSYSVYPLFIGLCQMVADRHGEPTVAQYIRNDVHEELAVALRALALINARNVNTVQIAEAPDKLNAKRNRNGKPPFFSYHTLSVFLDNTRAHRRIKLPTLDLMKTMWASSRLHQVAGHFKVRKTGIFWWNPHFRGTETQGIIQSEHEVK